MKNNELNINVEYLTRVEGHGNIVIDVNNGRLENCRLDIVESPRFFEGILRGRSIFEAQHITARICGICSVGHSLASIQAAEDALGFVPSAQTEKLRKLLLFMEILDSHILHIYLLVAPDLFGVRSFIPMIKSHNLVVRRALRMKKLVNDICRILAGRHIHPISSIVGGWTKLPSTEDIDEIGNILSILKKDMQETVELAKDLDFPVFERETEYIALVNDTDEYPLLHGDIGSTDDFRYSRSDYKKVTNEFVAPNSSAKHTRHNRDSYSVGAIARYNLNHGRLHPLAKSAADAIGLKPPVINPYLNTACQIIECVHCIEDSINVIDDLRENGIDYEEEIIVGFNEKNSVPVIKGEGVGAVEVPRGLLFHYYKIDEKGTIIDADCVIPTNQNVRNIEHDMKVLVPGILDRDKSRIELLLEMLVRAYDPCISCSAHFLDIKYI